MEALGGLLVIVFLIFLIPNLIDKAKKDTKDQADKERDRQKQEARKEVENHLRNKFLTSDLTKQILNYICNDNYTSNRPEEIIVRDDRIQSTLHGRNYTFSFVQNRVPPLHTYNWQSDMYEYGELFRWQSVNAVEIMAEVLNAFLDSQYDIAYHRKDGYVLMRLKPTKNF